MTTLRIRVKNKNDFNSGNKSYNNINIHCEEWKYSHDYDPGFRLTITGKIEIVSEAENVSIYRFWEDGWVYIIIQHNSDSFDFAKIIHI